MDATRFASLVCSVTAPASRRTLLGTSLVSMLSALGRRDAGAKKKPKKHKKKRPPPQPPVAPASPAAPSCPGGCLPGEGCLGGRCVMHEGTCPAGADSCSATNTVRCNANPQCSCWQRMEGGTRCSQENYELGVCDQCGSDADCLALGFPPGSSCVQDFGATCTHCLAGTRGYCVEPCGSGAGSCPVGADTCTGTCPGGRCQCGDDCACYTSRSGLTRCGRSAGCGNCTSDASCVARHGSGAFCVGFAAPNCQSEDPLLNCPPTDAGFCATSCPGEG
jgi:hypothetical protein